MVQVAVLMVWTLLVAVSAVDVTPIQKVLQMLEETTESIAEGKEKIVQLEADIDKAESDAAVLTGEIADLEGEIARIEGEIKSATEVRTKEKAEFEAIHLDYSESIDAIERAIAVLKAKSADVPQSLVEV